jgi:hypothetical protein
MDGQRIIAIGGSAGAIGAIQTLCGGLSPEIPAAICIVIHVGARGKTWSLPRLAEAVPFRWRQPSTARNFNRDAPMSRPRTGTLSSWTA